MKGEMDMDANIVLEAFYYLAKKIDAPIDKLAAIKLLFFADRYHIRKYGRLISDDVYFALPHGPVASNSLDILNIVMNGHSAGVDKAYLKRESANAFVSVDSEYDFEYLSDSDIEALDFTIENFSSYETWELRNLTHEYPEWKRYKSTLESNLSRREKIIMDDFFKNADLEDDPYSVITDKTVELSKEFYFNR